MSLRRTLTTAFAAVTAASAVAVPAAAATEAPSVQAIKQIASGLNQAWSIDFLPDGTGLFTQKDAKTISKIDKAGKVTTVQTIPGVSVTPEAGLLGIAVSPKYATDQTVFIYYTTSSDNRIAKLKLGQTPKPIVTGIPRGANFHHGGRIKFGPDGYLYAGTGDGQNGANAQNKNSLGGKVLRVTTDGAPAPGNPFNSRVYSYGHRNVQGLTWANGQLYVSDIGANKLDELNKVEPGKNYGWPTCEGPCDTAGMTNPVKAWPTAVATPSGLAAYKGSLYMASLKGGTFKLDLNGNGDKLWTDLGRTRDATVGPDSRLYTITPAAIYVSDGS